MPLSKDEPLIDDDTPLHSRHLGGQDHGLIPRDYTSRPLGYYGVPMQAVDMPLIPRNEWSGRIKEMEQTRSRLSDLVRSGNHGQPIPGLYQNGYGYCWGHSTAHAMMAIRARDHQPYIPLSAFAVCAMIKRGRNEGGWGALSLEFIQQHGIPSQQFWPQESADLRHDTPQMRANAALHRVSEGWVDLAPPVDRRKLSFDQTMTCLLSRMPVVMDLNWWSHSVCGLDPVEVEPGSFGVRIWNSHGESYGDRGMAVLRGARAIPDGAVAPRVVQASSL